MDVTAYLQFALALVFVLGLIGAAAVLARRLGLGHGVRPAGRSRRLSVVESLSLDPKRRLVLLRRDGVEHLVILGAGGDTVIEQAIGPVDGGFAAALRVQESAAAPARESSR